MNLNPDIWDLKFKKEGWTFAFGSLMQAYAQIASAEIVASGKTPDISIMKTQAYELYKLAKQMCADAVEENLIEKQKVAGNPDDIDIPV
jgi:hypothetical protein